jgi:glycosyltransferase involved in cell wall biosynthesis
MAQTPAVTAVITTRNRCAQAVEAARSVLEQNPPVIELFVCDDGSVDATPETFSAWATREPRLRYHRFDPAHGGPGAGRNHAIAHATGDWIAFLDDDDRWLEGKLAAQVPHLSAVGPDLVATNAWRTSGPRYFPDLHGPYEPTRRELLHRNPIIISSAVARRSLLQKIGGFVDLPWLRRGPLDYHTWLRLSDAGARFLVLADPLVRYDDPPDARLSSSALGIHGDLLRIAWSRWGGQPRDPALLEAALRHTSDTLLVARDAARRRIRRSSATRLDAGA